MSESSDDESADNSSDAHLPFFKAFSETKALREAPWKQLKVPITKCFLYFVFLVAKMNFGVGELKVPDKSHIPLVHYPFISQQSVWGWHDFGGGSQREGVLKAKADDKGRFGESRG